VLGVLLNPSAGIDLTHVGCKGSNPVLAEVMVNHVPLMFDGIGTSMPVIKGSKFKAFAVSASKRSRVQPDVPTFTELGSSKPEAQGWMGLWCTPDVPGAEQARARDAEDPVAASGARAPARVALRCRPAPQRRQPPGRSQGRL
jgi:tripartite-type tricarboxylate transporter receptor subunit TctC